MNKKSENIEVGDFLIITQDDTFPADVLLMTCSNIEKVCFVDTCSLNGEGNFKTKNCVNEIASLLDCKSPEDAMKNLELIESFIIKTEQPNDKLYSFDGSIKMKGFNRSISLDIKNLVLRESKLKNTK